MSSQKILILGAAGMLGHTLFNLLGKNNGFEVYGTIRNPDSFIGRPSPGLKDRILSGVDAGDFDTIIRALKDVKPDVVINCIGIIKQLPSADDPLTAISINALLPHKIAAVCGSTGARMIHISTDCVFSGDKGNYTEEDISDAIDLYGRTKFLGEVDYSHCITLRTSIIGHELKSKYGLIEWFLAQQGKVRGFTNAIYSGFPTVEIACIIAGFVIPNPGLSGLYQVSSEPVSKYDLLQLVAKEYKKQIEIEPFSDFNSDRSLNSARFRRETGYTPPAWPELVSIMYHDYVSSPFYKG